MKKQHILTLLLSCTLFMASCGGAESDTEITEDTEADTQTEETVPAEEQETETTETEKETETKKQPEAFTDYRKLTVSESEAPYYDAATGLFVVRFTEENVRYRGDDPCAVGISGDGEAYSVPGTIDLEAFPDFVNGDYYTGIAVKPGDTIYAGTYTVTITFDTYMVSFPCEVQ